MYPKQKYSQPLQQQGAMDPAKAEALMRLMQSASGGMAGPSMAGGIQQAPTGALSMLGNAAGGGQGGLAGMLAGGGGAAAPAMGGLESAFSGPLGGVMQGMLNFNTGMSKQNDDFIAALNGMPTMPKKNPMAQMGAFFDQFTMHGAGGPPQGGGIQGPGSIGTMAHNEATEAPGEADGLADDMPLNNDFSNDPDALAISNPRFGDGGRMTGTGFMGKARPSGGVGDPTRAPEDTDGMLGMMHAVNSTVGQDATKRHLAGSEMAQSSALDMGNTPGMRSVMGGAGPAAGLAGLLKGAGNTPPQGAPGGMRGGSPVMGSFVDEYAATGGGFGGKTPGQGQRAMDKASYRGGMWQDRGPGMGLPGIGTPASAALPPTQSNSAQSEYEKSKKRYYGGAGNF